ncbi:hypothetical protein VTN96DRAFT_10181 [Rasamsonia emersonii]
MGRSVNQSRPVPLGSSIFILWHGRAHDPPSSRACSMRYCKRLGSSRAQKFPSQPVMASFLPNAAAKPQLILVLAWKKNPQATTLPPLERPCHLPEMQTVPNGLDKTQKLKNAGCQSRPTRNAQILN